MAITYRDFIHPEDEKAIQAIRAIPAYEAVSRWLMKVGVEPYYHSVFMADHVRLSPKQLPKIYGLLPPVCRKFGIDEPEFYLQMDHSKAWARRLWTVQLKSARQYPCFLLGLSSQASSRPTPRRHCWRHLHTGSVEANCRATGRVPFLWAMRKFPSRRCCDLSVGRRGSPPT